MPGEFLSFDELRCEIYIKIYMSKVFQKQQIKFHHLNTGSLKVVLGFVLFLFSDEICQNLHDDLA